MTERELVWAAGLFEGEGTIRISKPAQRNWGSLTVSVVNTDKEIVDYFQTRWPGYCKAATGLRPDQRDAWVWVIAARRAAAFLSAIAPFVVSSRVKTKLAHALAFQAQKRVARGNRSEEYRQDQWDAYWWMGQLNLRGRPDADQHRR